MEKYSQSWQRALLNKKCAVVFVFLITLGGYLIYKLVDIQLINYKNYQLKTLDQFTQEVQIDPKRGTIYDRNMTPLAISATAERIFISPNTIPQMTVAEYIKSILDAISNDADRKAQAELFDQLFTDKTITVSEDIANELSRILGIDKAMVLTKAAKLKRADETIKQKVEVETANQLREIVSAKKFGKYIHFAEQSKRYYPFGDLASHIIGFTGSENTGLAGIEAYYESYLKGIPGKVVTAKNGLGGEMPYKYEKYISAQDGTDIMLTVDWTIQSILEKYLDEALIETQAKNRVAGIIMDVTNGEILADSTKPDFDLNSPFELDPASLALFDSFTGTDEERAAYKTNLIYSLWKNKSLTEIYEPGSTFKIITASICVEEQLVSDTDTFYCPGYIKIPGFGQPIRCARTTGHGTINFEQALQQSCNPAFVMLSQRIGNDLFYKYYKAFGYTERTGIDLPGEAINYFFNLNTFNSVDLAVASFGQNFKVTPISHLSAISTVANGGYKVTPHVLKATLDKNGNILKSYDVDKTRQVISESTANRICSILEQGVIDGGSKNAAVVGYKIAAKTGTSVKTELKNKGKTEYTSSCVAFAPADDPKIAIIIMIDEPIGAYYGGVIAAPVVSKVLSEVLPYLGIEPKYTDSELSLIANPIDDYRGRNVNDASDELKTKKLNCKIIGDGDTVKEQIPAHGTSLMQNGIVVLYTGDAVPENTVKVPNIIGMTAANANKAIINAGLNINLVDSTMDMVDGAIAIKQSIPEKELVAPGTVISVEFRHYNGIE
ncbi:MAG: penicillin-binding transpeptidase domain-containing protein [Oscillospiraceae bacterium]|nr:penicillin-binding transpeptidase domain-containing protein [Oscillospiraceae bacterium]